MTIVAEPAVLDPANPVIEPAVPIKMLLIEALPAVAELSKTSPPPVTLNVAREELPSMPPPLTIRLIFTPPEIVRAKEY